MSRREHLHLAGDRHLFNAHCHSGVQHQNVPQDALDDVLPERSELLRSHGSRRDGNDEVLAETTVEEPKEATGSPVPKVGPKSAREEKQAILEKLAAYREKHGLGSFNLIAARANRKGITGDILRMLLNGDAKLEIADWRAVGKVIDELGGGDGDGKV